MAEVAPRESIMSLVIVKSEQRRILKGASSAVEPLIEDYGGNEETDEETSQYKRDTVWCFEPANHVKQQAERDASMESQNAEKNEEKPNLKRANNLLEMSLTEGERSLKKMKISGDSRDGDVIV